MAFASASAIIYPPNHLSTTSTVPILLLQAVFKSGPNWKIVSDSLSALIAISATECEQLFGKILDREGIREQIGGSNSRVVKQLALKLTNTRKNSLIKSIISRANLIAEVENQISILNSGKLDERILSGLTAEVRLLVESNPISLETLPEEVDGRETSVISESTPIISSPPAHNLTKKEKLALAKERKAETRKNKRIHQKTTEENGEEESEEDENVDEEVEEELKPKPKKGAAKRGGRKRKGSEPADGSPVTDRTKKRLKTDELTESDQEKDHLARLLRFKRGLSGVLKLTTEFPASAAFITPVKLSDAPGYDIAVKRPMCLKEISAKVRTGVVTSAVEVQRDVALICANAVMFNDEGVEVVKQARELWEYFGQQLQLFLATHQAQD